MRGITSVAKKAGATIAAAFGLKKLIDFGKSCTELGSDLTEVQSVVDVVFPNMTAQVDKFAKSAAANFGLSETMAKKYTGLFGTMAQSFGFSEKQAYDMGTALAGLAGDVASFYNITQDEAYTKLKAVFSGETEVLKDIGIVMTQNALDAYALANGYEKTTAQMSEAEKVALRYEFIQKQLSLASGDFLRTQDQWANQIRVLKLQFQSLKASIGKGLINVLLPVVKMINTVLKKLMVLADAFKSFTELITGNKSSGSSSAGQMSDLGSAASDASTGLDNASDSADTAASSAKKAGSAAKKAAKEMRSLMGFDQINKLSDPSDNDDADSSDDDGSDKGLGKSNIVPDIAPTKVNFGELAEGETAIDKLDKKFLNLFESIKKGIEPTVKSLKRLWNEGLAELGKFSWQALKDFWNYFLVPVAKWTFGTGLPRFIDALNNGLMNIDYGKINAALTDLWDALTPFAINIGEGLLWFWENVLVPLGTWTANEVVPRFLETLSSVISILNAILEALKPLFKWFWDTVLLPVAKWTAGAFLEIWDGINQALDAFAKWCTNNPGAVQGITVAIGAFFGAWKVVELVSFIQQAGGVIKALGLLQEALFGSIAAKLADKAETMYLTALYAKDFVVGVAQTISSLAQQAAAFVSATAAKIADAAAQAALTVATTAWNVVCTIATGVTTVFGAAVAFLTSPFGIAVVAITAAIAIGVLLYKNWDTVQAKAKQLNDFLSGVFARDWSKNFGIFGDILNGFMKSVENIYKAVKKFLKGIIDFIAGVFTGDWSRAWTGVKEIFGGIWDAFVGLVKTPVNLIIGILNGLITAAEFCVNAIGSALNSINVDVPDWVTDLTGLTSIGFNLPTWHAAKIPYLAQGAYVKANTPQLAMIGDNLHQGELVAPEDKLQAMVNTAVATVAGSGGVSRAELESIVNNAVMRIVAGLSQMGFYLDGELMAKAVKKAQENLDMRYNPVRVI